jgi:hypothetical protein
MAILASTEIESSAWKKLGIFWTALSFLFFFLISVYLGSTFDPTRYQNNISINVVNFDRNSPLGEAFRTVTRVYTLFHSNSSSHSYKERVKLKNPDSSQTTPLELVGVLTRAGTYLTLTLLSMLNKLLKLFDLEKNGGL